MIAVRAIAVIFTFYAPAIFSGGCPGYDAMPGHCERTHRFLFPVRHPDSLNTDYIPSSVTIPIRATALATLNLSFNFSIRLLTAGSEIHKESAISLAVLPDFNSRRVSISCPFKAILLPHIFPQRLAHSSIQPER